MNRQSFRQLSIIITAQLLVSVSHSANLCQSLFLNYMSSSSSFKQKTENVNPSYSFIYRDDLSIQHNLSRFASSYEIKINWNKEVDNFYDLLPPPKTIIDNDVPLVNNKSNGVSKRTLGLHFERKEDKTEGITTEPIFRSNFPYPEFLGEKWSYEEQNYQFFNIGSRLLLKEANSRVLRKKLFQTLTENPGRSIIIPFDSLWSQARQTLNSRQAWASNKATQNYKKRKPYLSDEDLFYLRHHDSSIKNNNDFFVLTKDTSKNPLEMTAEEFDQNLAMMVRIARHSNSEDPFLPLILGGDSPARDLPNAFRAKGEIKAQLQNFLDELSQNGKKIAELSRVNRFQEIPQQIRDAFWLKILELGKNPEAPIDIFILECDSFVEKVFSRYGFKRLARVSDASSGSEEYLMYLDTGSNEFKSVTAELRKKSQNIFHIPEARIPPAQNWETKWVAPEGYLDY